MVTAATGQLGQLVIKSLLGRVAPETITVAVRSASKVPPEWTSKGIAVKEIDYNASSSEWAKATAGIKRLLLISSSANGPERQQQHRQILQGAKQAGVEFIAYTSILYCDKEYLSLAADHHVTEGVLAELGIPHALLRHGWYTENYLNSAEGWKHGVHLSCAPTAKFSPAARADYAEADAAVVASGQAGTFELAGDEAMTYDALAETAGKALGKEVKHVALAQGEFAQKLQENGLPAMWANIFAGIDEAAQRTGGLYNESKTISKLIGRPTVSWSETITAALS